MNNTMKKLLALLLVLCMVISCAFVLTACKDDDDKKNDNKIPEDEKPDPDDDKPNPDDDKEDEDDNKVVLDFVAPVRPADATLPEAKIGEYTYRGGTTSLGSNWNPHTWETSADDSILGYLSSPFVTMEAKDTEEGLYQWVGEMATEIHDITAANQDKLIKYNVTLPKDKKAADITSGYVYEIKLNPNAKWQDGSIINAEDYVYSMQQLLNPDMKNYRANLYISGESALAGAFNYYYSKDVGFYKGVGDKYATNQEALDAGETLYINVYEAWEMNEYVDAEGNTCPQWLPIDGEVEYYLYDENGEVADVASGKSVYEYYLGKGYGPYFEVGKDLAYCIAIYVLNDNMGASYDGVGLYVVDDYTIVYVCQTAIEFNYFLTSCTSTWLVHEELYERALKNLEEKTHTATTHEEFLDIAENRPGFIKAMWCGDSACEDLLKEKTGGVKSRCIPFVEDHLSDTCVCCGKPAKHMVIWGRQY